MSIVDATSAGRIERPRRLPLLAPLRYRDFRLALAGFATSLPRRMV